MRIVSVRSMNQGESFSRIVKVIDEFRAYIETSEDNTDCKKSHVETTEDKVKCLRNTSLITRKYFFRLYTMMAKQGVNQCA